MSSDKIRSNSQREVRFEKKIKVPEKLLKFEERMKEKEKQYLKQFHDVDKNMHVIN